MGATNMSIRNLVLLVAVIAAACLGAATAHASSLRTWVSNAGSDSNPCSVTQPCLTFAGALANTSSGGEINCLNAGGFSPVTITISVTIDCEGTSNGGILVGGEGYGITISTAGVIVNLIGLEIDGENGAGLFGVFVNAAATVNIRNCKVFGSSGAGIASQSSTGGATLTVDNAFVAHNGYGINENEVSGVANMTVRNSNINNNGTGIAVNGGGGGTHTGATIEQTTLSFNGTGLAIVNPGAVALIGNSTVVNNNVGVSNSGGTLLSFKNNRIGGNSTDGTPLTAYPGGPLN
jgi:hypothetical protein